MLLKTAFTAVLAAASTASALAVGNPQTGLEQRGWDDTPTTFVHVVLFSLKPELSEAQKQEVMLFRHKLVVPNNVSSALAYSD